MTEFTSVGQDSNSIVELDRRESYKELRSKIAQEIEESRKPYGVLAKENQGEDRQFYLGVCNGMNLAKLIVENRNDSN